YGTDARAPRFLLTWLSAPLCRGLVHGTIRIHQVRHRLLLLLLGGALVAMAAALDDADAGDGAQQRHLRFGPRLHVRRCLQLGLRKAPRLLRAGLVDLVDALDRIRKDGDTTLIHLHEAAGHGQELPLAVVEHAQLAGLERRQQRLVTRQDTELT